MAIRERDVVTEPCDVNEIKVNALDVVIVCRSCGAENGGFVVDPRGQAHTCDECGAGFRITEDAVVSIW